MAKDQVMTVEDVFATLSSYMNTEHVAFVQKAYEVAREAHKEQFRSSGSLIFYIPFK